MAHRDRRLDSHLVTLTSPGSFAAEQYQGLHLTIERLGRNRTLQVIAVTSPAAGEGKTLTAINLAGALARGSDDARVLLIDADLRRPAVARQLDADVLQVVFTGAPHDERVERHQTEGIGGWR